MTALAQPPTHPSTAVPSTIPERVRHRAMATPDTVSMRVKKLGIWREITWAGYWDQVQTAAHGLMSLGLEPGDRVGVHSLNRPEWIVADSACLAARLVCMGLYPTNPAAEVQYLLEDSGTRVLIAEDQEQVDKAMAVKDRLPALERIVYIEPRGVDVIDDPILMSWDELMARGAEHRAAHPGELDRRIEEIRAEDLAYLVYTSGTTGPPKGAMITVANVSFAMEMAGSDQGLVNPPPGPDDVIISYLPLCHIFEKLISQVNHAGVGWVTHFGESIDTLSTDLREVQPTFVQGVPRIWEKMHAFVLVRMSSASRLKRWNYGLWTRTASRIGRQLAARGGRHTVGSRVMLGLGDLFLYRALKERLGLRRCRYALSAAAPIAPEILEFFMGIGVPIYEAYGMTEQTGVATRTLPGRVKLGTVGEAYPNIDIEVVEETGEVLTRHPGTFAGYWNRPDATAAAIDADGWLHTGDVGEWDGTHLRIVDRIKDIIITAGGKNVSPSEIENSLKMSPFVGEAIVIGDKRKYLSALIGIDYDVVSEWAQRRRLTYTTYRDLAEKPEVRELIQKVVDGTNASLAQAEQVKRFGLLTKELDHEDGELTATQKVKRSAIEAMFAEQIEDLYR
ncbi:MAG TPA: AMP-binding protein [Acidimicrobiia bacterium]